MVVAYDEDGEALFELLHHGRVGQCLLCMPGAVPHLVFW
jgi:hypothetical protein